MSTDTATLKIGHASLEVFDTDRQALSDMGKLIEQDFDLLGGTEAGSPQRQLKFEKQLMDAGYRAFMLGRTDSWLAVKRDLVDAGWTTRYDEVFGSGKELGHPHHHTGRGVLECSFTNKDLGRITFIGGVHYLTKGRTPTQAREDDPRCHVDHQALNKQYGLAVSDRALRGAMGSGIVFVTGDMNLIDRTDDVFFRKPLTTCWDEKKKWPNTGHGNIDVVASADRDGRVECKSAEVLDDSELFLATDHFLVVTKYRVRKINH